MKRSTLIADSSWVSDANGSPLPEEKLSPVELTHGDMDSARKFWGLVLLLAGCDHASSVQFFPHLGEDCLSCTVARVNYTMAPPPGELRDWLLRVGRNLCAGSNWQGILWGWRTRVLCRQSSNMVTLEFWGNRIQWDAAFGPRGLVFHRRSETDECANVP